MVWLILAPAPLPFPSRQNLKKDLEGEMKTNIQIRNRDGNVIYEFESENNTIAKTVESAVKQRVDLQRTCLRGADLRGANLRGADLEGVDLEGANLRGADLRGADLEGADLRGARIEWVDILRSPLNILKYQKGTLTAYKYLRDDMKSPYHNFKYVIGKEYSTSDFDSNEFNNCGKGLNVATLEWCLKDSKVQLNKFRYIEVEFKAEDIVAIPYWSDGKFRVRKLKVVREVTKEELKKIVEVG